MSAVWRTPKCFMCDERITGSSCYVFGNRYDDDTPCGCRGCVEGWRKEIKNPVLNDIIFNFLFDALQPTPEHWEDDDD